MDMQRKPTDGESCGEPVCVETGPQAEGARRPSARRCPCGSAAAMRLAGGPSHVNTIMENGDVPCSTAPSRPAGGCSSNGRRASAEWGEWQPGRAPE